MLRSLLILLVVVITANVVSMRMNAEVTHHGLETADAMEKSTTRRSAAGTMATVTRLIENIQIAIVEETV